jgi:hypothetical protein
MWKGVLGRRDPRTPRYAAITTSIGTPSSTGQRCAYLVPATNDDAHFENFLVRVCFSGAILGPLSQVSSLGDHGLGLSFPTLVGRG